MDKQHIISLIQEQLAAGKISKNDLMEIAGQKNTGIVEGAEESSKNLIHVFYAIGAIIAIIGVAILVGQNWLEIGFAGRIFSTLGISLITYIVALLFKSPEQKILSQVLFVIAAALAPLGSYVLLHEASIDFTAGTQIMTALVLTIVFGTALFISKKNILILITLGFASWAYTAGVFNIFDVNAYNAIDFLQWAVMLLGSSYILIGYGIKSIWKSGDAQDEKEKNRVSQVLYTLGTLAILGGGISIGGFFDLFFIALIFAAFYGSVFLKSRGMLTLASLFLMAHIIKLTSLYFVNSLGWPIALIGVGFLVIGVGYGTFYLNKKFIAVK